MSKPKISVIVPVYNVEDYITEALESLLNQTIIENIEVIMIDDGSTDESRYIIERYALNYDNFYAYHKENEGQGIARNKGLDLANGEYVIFMDPDDYVPPEAYETLYDLASKNDCDIAAGNALRFARMNVWEETLFKNSFKDINEVIVSTTLKKMPSLLWDTVTWNKLYKRKFLDENDIRFPELKVSYQDIPFSLKAYILADSISITPEICYYWRLRNDHSSATQQDYNIRNFKDRLYILRCVNELFEEYDMDLDIRNMEYLKWINHDLKFFMKRFNQFPEKYHRQLFDEIRELVCVMPDDLIESLNSYKKVLFRMILNGDFDDFVLFAPLENELFEDPSIPDFIDDEYKSYFDFAEAVKDEELISELTDVDFDEIYLFLEFEGNIHYLSGEDEYEVSANLVDENNRYPLEVNDSIIAIPFSLLETKSQARIEVCYIFKEFIKESFLKNRHRQSLDIDDFYLDLNVGINSYLFINKINKSDNSVEILDIEFEDDEFILKGMSKDRISEVHLENVISFKRNVYPVEYCDANEFSFRIQNNDLMNVPVKKWEMNCAQSLNSIRVSQPFEFFRAHDKIRFINSRNKIYIENDAYKTTEEIKNLKSANILLKNENEKLKCENTNLKRQNSQLKDKISEFSSRKAVRIADRLKLN